VPPTIYHIATHHNTNTTQIQHKYNTNTTPHYREGSDVFAVNSLHFHRQNTFVSAGSDGTLSVWDKDVRHRLVMFDQFKKEIPITDCKFNPMVRACCAYYWHCAGMRPYCTFVLLLLFLSSFLSSPFSFFFFCFFFFFFFLLLLLV
jgi:WD40 repeat protein